MEVDHCDIAEVECEVEKNEKVSVNKEIVIENPSANEGTSLTSESQEKEINMMTQSSSNDEEGYGTTQSSVAGVTQSSRGGEEGYQTMENSDTNDMTSGDEMSQSQGYKSTENNVVIQISNSDKIVEKGDDDQNSVKNDEITQNGHNNVEENAIIPHIHNKNENDQNCAETIENEDRREISVNEGTSGNIQPAKKQRKSRIKIMDSDSEEDINTVTEGLNNEETEEGTKGEKKTGGVFDSDNINEENKNGKEENINKKLSMLCDPESSDDEDYTDAEKPKRPALFDGEDEDENSIALKLDDENCAENKKPKRPVLFDDEDEGENSAQTKMEDESRANKKSTLWDSESSDEEDGGKESNEEEGSTRVENGSDVNNEETGIKKLTPREALEQMKEIQSDSQRRVREASISLPYHVPKQRTLREFLQKRPKFADSVGIPIQKTPAAMSIKLTNKHLEVISKKLEEREKEVEKFFKSDSEESDGDADEDYKPEEEEVSSETKDKAEEDDKTELNEPEPNLEKETVENCTESVNMVPEIEQMDIDDAPETNDQICDDILKIASDIQHSLCDNEKPEDACFPEDEVTVNNGDVTNGDEVITNEEEPQPVPDRKKLLLERIGDIKPRLSGGPNLVIDLEDNTTKPDEVSQLMDRFIQHNSRRKSHKNKVELSIVTVTGAGEIQKEKMSLEIEEAESQHAVVETPGEKLQKLRTELQKQIAEQRTKLWQQKMTHKSNEEEEEEVDDDMDVYKGEKDSCCDAEAVEDDNECDKMETNDMDVEEDEDDENEGDEEDNADNENDIMDENNEENEESECESENGSEDNNTPITASAKKQLKRIIMNDDSDDEEVEPATETPARGMNRSGSTDSWDDQPQPAQKYNEKTPNKARIDSKPDLALISPVSHITGLQSFNSGSNFLQESPKSPVFLLPPEPSPLKGWQKKLFSTENNSDDESEPNRVEENHDSEQPPNTQELLNLCSGKFPGLTQEESPSKSLETPSHTTNNYQELEPDVPPSTQDLLDLCSGKFTGFTQEGSTTKSNNPHSSEIASNSTNKCEELETELPPSTQDLLNLCSGKFTGFTQEKNTLNKILDTNETNSENNDTFQTPKIPEAEQNNTTSVLDDDDKLISQILDEEEMEAFKKKFESPVTTASQANVVHNAAISACINFDSDDDDESDNDDRIIGVKRNKNFTAIYDSDDDDADDENNADEEIDLCDENEEDEGDELVGNEEREVEYDSEENEIEVDKSDNTKPMKMKDFFENEAELSESEWGSADEDEKNLDQMEFELGDMDKIDQNKVKRDLEKIHMRQILDEDNREVKILQELLLEDGELHGGGRQKQFRWKNIDANNENNDENGPEKENDDYLLEDEENEEEWRKKRFEREVFLRKNQKKEDETEAEVDITASSQVLKLGQKFVLKNRVQVDKKVTEEVKGFTSFTMQAKRGSFLARTDQVLTRVAEYTKETTMLNGAATSKKHFVFQTVNVDKTGDMEKKRKATEIGTPQALKKLRIDKLSPALHKSGNNRMKKLFSNL